MQKDLIPQYLDMLKTAMDGISHDELLNMARVLREAADRGAAIYVCGNGGSAAMASHFACDLAKGASHGFDRRYQAFALSDNTATMMAIANDLSYDDIFSEQLKSCFRPGDVVIGLSGSGNSRNVLKAVEYANQNGGVTIGMTGYINGRLKQVAQHNVNLNINHMQIAEDLHLILNHILVNLLTDGRYKP
jgi:D-sedoheptulose 7-phosphate isomerase